MFKRLRKNSTSDSEDSSDVYLVCCYFVSLKNVGNDKISFKEIEKIFGELKNQTENGIKANELTKKDRVRLVKEGYLVECKSSKGSTRVILTPEGFKRAKELISKKKIKYSVNNEVLINRSSPMSAGSKIPVEKAVISEEELKDKLNEIEATVDEVKNNINATKIRDRSTLPPGEVILLIDTREVKTKKDRSFLYNQLRENNVKCETRALPLGDALWVYRCKGDDTDYVLPCIIERKKIDDLASSIVDGRYVEQKRRLKSCGLENVIYLVEGEPNANQRVTEGSLQSAIMHTKVISGFVVVKVSNIAVRFSW